MLRLFDFVNGKLVERKFDRSLLDQAVSHTSWVDAQDTSDKNVIVWNYYCIRNCQKAMMLRKSNLLRVISPMAAAFMFTPCF